MREFLGSRRPHCPTQLGFGPVLQGVVEEKVIPGRPPRLSAPKEPSLATEEKETVLRSLKSVCQVSGAGAGSCLVGVGEGGTIRMGEERDTQGGPCGGLDCGLGEQKSPFSLEERAVEAACWWDRDPDRLPAGHQRQ